MCLHLLLLARNNFICWKMYLLEWCQQALFALCSIYFNMLSSLRINVVESRKWLKVTSSYFMKYYDYVSSIKWSLRGGRTKNKINTNKPLKGYQGYENDVFGCQANNLYLNGLLSNTYWKDILDRNNKHLSLSQITGVYSSGWFVVCIDTMVRVQ